MSRQHDDVFQKSQRDWWGASLLKYLCACWLFLKPRPHERFHWKKRIFFEAFSPSVHTETMKTEVFENGSQSSGFRKKMRFQMKTHWCGRVTSKTLEWCQSKTVTWHRSQSTQENYACAVFVCSVFEAFLRFSVDGRKQLENSSVDVIQVEKRDNKSELAYYIRMSTLKKRTWG